METIMDLSEGKINQDQAAIQLQYYIDESRQLDEHGKLRWIKQDRMILLERLAKIKDELDTDEKQDDDSIFQLELAVRDIIAYSLMSNDYTRKKYYGS
ncbi:MAG: hypothetical protein EZS28_040846 [Streblomastix strix]|uniref:Uncharacterized protein n=1 Tax=Streblomastix strix TaxID=222440 RepID=A0A5J4TZS2_9EUKA|nr:MAG: hypothetical protein EZS28_040846 [Streblomastix strix]